MQTKLLKLKRRSQSGSSLLAALGILALTSMVIGAALYEARDRYRTCHQSLRWSQAAHAAEAGVELALMSAQQDSWVADGWPAAPGSPGITAETKSFPLSDGGTGSGSTTAEVSVDKIDMSGVEWLRIRSVGLADLSGGAVVGAEPQDVMLRKLTLRQDRNTGASVGTTPRATRMLEVLARPRTKSPYVRPILTDQKFSMSGGEVDSFDSDDPAKSTGGLYDVAKRQSNGEVGINDTAGISDFGNAFIYGNVGYTGADPTNMTNVQGAVSSSFNVPVNPIIAPTWTTFNATPALITSTMTLTGGTKGSPARYKVSSVNLGTGKVLTVVPHAAGAESYVEVWVTGNFTTSGNGYIDQQPGVHVTYHIAGDVTVTRSSFQNQTNLAAKNVLKVISPAAGVNQQVNISGSGAMIGVVDAPGAAVTASGNGSVSGAIIGKSMDITGGGTFHYDEALSKVGGTEIIPGYHVASIVEAVR